MVTPFCKYLSTSLSLGECEDHSCEDGLSNATLLERDRSGFFDHRPNELLEQIHPPNIEHELGVAISILQQESSITGDNVFDHLADIIKRVVQDRPPNIVDYFEEFSHNIREQKLRVSERFPLPHFEHVDVELSKSAMKLMNLPVLPEDFEYDVCKENKPKGTKKFSQPLKGQEIEKVQRKLAFNENVLRLHLYWTLCGFGFNNEEVSKLSYSMQKIQFHPIVEHARFWGKIYGLASSYYIVEVMLTESEMGIRLNKMRVEMTEMLSAFRDKEEQSVNIEMDLSFIPGALWQNYSEGELEIMKSTTKNIFVPKTELKFDIPPEAIGTGLNRRTYFVTTDLNNDWIELPIVTPKQIQSSRKIKKFFTGDLEAEFVSYPNFPGTEKHLLRAMIARITSATYIAPDGYYRRQTKEDLGDKYDGIDESDDEDEDEELNNDAIIIESKQYEPHPKQLLSSKSWVHVRPNILEQGRVTYFDDAKALEVIRKYSLEQLEDEENMEEADEEDILEEDDKISIEYGPVLFNACSEDCSDEVLQAWTLQRSSVHNNINQLTIARSNLWPGAFSFTFDKYSDSIYLGWGFKFNARNMNNSQIPPIQEDYGSDKLQEIPDPSVESEEAWRIFQIKKLELEEEHEGEEEEKEESIC